MIRRSALPAVLAVLIALLVGCQSNTRPPLPYVGNEVAPGAVAPAAAPTTVDVGIGVFEDGVVDLDPDQVETTPAVRRAEAHYMPQMLARTLARRGGFGQVRVVPRRLSEMDVWVDARIVRSTGVELELEVTVSDAKGRVWYTRDYRHEVNRYVFDADPTRSREDAFQPIYEHIADDLVRELARRSPAEVAELRTIAQLQFARRFAPEQYGDYLARDDKGVITVRRLPAGNDPVFARLDDIRQRDRLFTDRLAQYYETYAERMAPPYDDWRRASHEELVEMRKLKTSEVVRKVGGALAVLGGLAAVVATGRANGAPLEEVSLARLREEEPHVRATAAVLSPSTGILDVHGLFRALRAIAEENGLPGDILLAAADDPGVQEEFEANTEEALRRDVFGIPTYVYGDLLLWGQDRLDFLERALAR